MQVLRRRVAGDGDTTQAWRWPTVLGVGAAALLWMVWYFTVTPCTMERAEDGLCNAGVVARFISHQILAQCILLGLAVAAVKGGYDEIMVSRERKRADAAEQRADEAEERLRQERKRVDELIEEFRAEIRAGQEARRTEQEARLAEHEARRTEQEANRIERQAMMEALAQMSNTIAQLLERQNGRSSPED